MQIHAVTVNVKFHVKLHCQIKWKCSCSGHPSQENTSLHALLRTPNSTSAPNKYQMGHFHFQLRTVFFNPRVPYLAQRAKALIFSARWCCHM
jgi:hypothetical protein